MDDKLFEITDQPISADDVSRRVITPAVGAVVTFVGVVRGNNLEREVCSLEYEAYPDMAEPILAQIGTEIRARWPVEQVAIVHRVGHLQIGEVSVVIAIASAHRQGAFDACSYAIDRVKQIVPVWKKEYLDGGEVWLEGPEATEH